MKIGLDTITADSYTSIKLPPESEYSLHFFHRPPFWGEGRPHHIFLTHFDHLERYKELS